MASSRESGAGETSRPVRQTEGNNADGDDGGEGTGTLTTAWGN